MKDAWKVLPLWAVAQDRREVVEPTSLGERVVHYSIPSVDNTGTGQVEDTEDIRSIKLRLYGGEVLISKLNPRKTRVLQVQESDLPIVSSTEFVGLQASETLTSRFLAYLLQTESVRQHLDARVESATRSHQRVDPADIMHLLVPVPELQEQRRIADFLDAETARIDRLVAARVRQRAALEERSYADVSETLIPGTTHAPCGIWPWAWLPKVGDDRPLVRLGYVCRLQSGITVDGSRDVSGDSVTRPYLHGHGKVVRYSSSLVSRPR
jgi:type I restriction enzyme S subunit